MINMILVYSISGLSIILGFFALLKQKTYIDPDTNQPTEVEIPIFGKLKSNYPALVFVFLGIGLAFISFNTLHPPKKVDWEIKGSFTKEDDQDIVYANGQLKLIPAPLASEIGEGGIFEIKMKIEEGKTFEDIIQCIDFTYDTIGNASIITKDELKAYDDRQETLIEIKTKNYRKYRAVPLKPILSYKQKEDKQWLGLFSRLFY